MKNVFVMIVFGMMNIYQEYIKNVDFLPLLMFFHITQNQFYLKEPCLFNYPGTHFCNQILEILALKNIYLPLLAKFPNANAAEIL